MKRHYHTAKFYAKKYWLRAALAVGIVASSVHLYSQAPAYHEAFIRWRLRSTVVHIQTTIGGKPWSGGTGFFVVAKAADEGIGILTNHHVCSAPPDEIRAQYNVPYYWEHNVFINDPTDESQIIPMVIVKMDQLRDLCLLNSAKKGDLRALKKDVMPLRLVNTDPELGDRVWSGGYPGKRGFTIRDGRLVTTDVMQHIKVECYRFGPFAPMMPGCSYGQNSVIATFLAEPGQSGSPVIDELGRLTNVVWGTYLAFGNKALLVPTEDLREFLK